MRSGRLILAGVVSLGLAPGTFVRTIPPPPDYISPVLVERLGVNETPLGRFTLVGAWRLASRNDHFGGYSALLARPGGKLLAASDAGRLMILSRPDRENGGPPQLGEFADYAGADKYEVDIESLAQDPASGTIWAGFESSNAIKRFDSEFAPEKAIRAPAMEHWGSNSGAESLARLADGRFLVIEERSTSNGRHRALLFPGDPTDEGEPVELELIGIEGYRPVDATPLPDGRALVLFRRIVWALPPGFASAIAVVDPQGIEPGGALRAKPLAVFEDRIPQENYEGMALTVEEDGARHLWLISDDNFAAHQRTLLLKLRWNPAPKRQKARRQPARLSGDSIRRRQSARS